MGSQFGEREEVEFTVKGVYLGREEDSKRGKIENRQDSGRVVV